MTSDFKLRKKEEEKHRTVITIKGGESSTR